MTLTSDYVGSALHRTSTRAFGTRSFQLLNRHDLPKIEAFFLSFDFDQRRSFFGAGMSNAAVRNYCWGIDWSLTSMIARSGPCCLEAVAILVSIPPRHNLAEFHVASPLTGSHRPGIDELAELAIEVGACRYQALIVSRELAHPDLLELLRENPCATFDGDIVRLDLWPHYERHAATTA